MLNNDPNDFDDVPVVVQRVERSTNWIYPVIFIVILIIAFNMWPGNDKFFTTETSSNKPSDIPLKSRNNQQLLSTTEKFFYTEEKSVSPAFSPAAHKNTAKVSSDIPANTPAIAVSVQDLKIIIETLPMDGIFLEELLEEEDGLTINGYAHSPQIVGKYMRLIQQNVNSLSLVWVKSDKRNQQTVSGFSMKVKK
ncbi:MAG: hypothetical protein ACI9SC_001312 [Gammaproteobacteria bacterium]|jgi:hypothetical protein